MKYVLTWEFYPGATEETQARSLQVFSKWSPPDGVTFLQFLARVDGGGGFAVVETDNPGLLARTAAIFAPFLSTTIYPVLDNEEAVRLAGEAIEFRGSAS